MVLRACVPCGLVYRDGAEFCGVDGTRTVLTDRDPLVGRTVSHYRVEERIAMGGVAAVYRATHLRLGHAVVLKVLFGEMASRPLITERFRREAHAACRIKHKNVVRTFDYGTSEFGAVYLAMEHLEGMTLLELVDRDGPLTPVQTRAIATEVAQGLSAIHGLGYVHRDVKSGNVMLVREDGVNLVKILDFGLVSITGDAANAGRLTQDGTILGTPQYMAPEVIRGDPVTSTVDLYGLGVTMFEMLTGHAPFVGPLTELLTKHLNDPPPELDTGTDLDDLVAGLLAKSSDGRPSNAAEVVERLGRPQKSAVGAVPTTHPSPRRWWLAGALAGMLVTASVLALAPSAEDSEPVEVSEVEGDQREATVLPQPPNAARESEPQPKARKRRPVRKGRTPRRSPGKSPRAEAAAVANVVEVMITSTPSGATVSMPQGILGVTPVTTFLRDDQRVDLVLEKPGHAKTSVRWTRATGNRVAVRLERDESP